MEYTLFPKLEEEIPEIEIEDIWYCKKVHERSSDKLWWQVIQLELLLR